jgi:hypothetical protein
MPREFNATSLMAGNTKTGEREKPSLLPVLFLLKYIHVRYEENSSASIRQFFDRVIAFFRRVDFFHYAYRGEIFSTVR